MLQLQEGAGKPFVKEGNLREVKALSTPMHSACPQRTLCNHAAWGLNPHTDSKSTTTFWGKGYVHIDKFVAEDQDRKDNDAGWGRGMRQKPDHDYHIP